jgi:hypothetical protein
MFNNSINCIYVRAVTLHVTDATFTNDLQQVASELYTYIAAWHQVTKSIKKIEERRSGLTHLINTKVATCKNSCELTNSSEELCPCVAWSK